MDDWYSFISYNKESFVDKKNLITTFPRGGLPILTSLCHVFESLDLPYCYMTNAQNINAFTAFGLSEEDGIYDNILFVDDCYDTGKAYDKFKKILSYNKDATKNIFNFFMYKKKVIDIDGLSNYNVNNIDCKVIDTHTWIVFPWEREKNEI